MTEQWRAVPFGEYEGFYEVSSFGRVRSVERQVRVRASTRRAHYRTHSAAFLKGTIGHRGYVYVTLAVERRRRTYRVHELVLAAFRGPRPEGWVCNHKDGDKTNNVITNLEYTSYSGNLQHAYDTGLRTVTAAQLAALKLGRRGKSPAIPRQENLAHRTGRGAVDG